MNCSNKNKVEFRVLSNTKINASLSAAVLLGVNKPKADFFFPSAQQSMFSPQKTQGEEEEPQEQQQLLEFARGWRLLC